MKNLIKVSFLFVAALLIFASCNKDQKCVNWLEGDWKVTGMTHTDSAGTKTDLMAQFTSQGLTLDGTMNFSKYSVKKDEMGASVMYTHVHGTVFGFPVDEKDTTNYDYKIKDDCETVWMREKGQTTSDESTIEEASKSKMVIASKDTSDNSTTRITIEKK